MIKLCFTSSHGYTIPGLVLHQDLGISRVIKDGRSVLGSPGTRQEIIPAGYVNLKLDQLECCKPPVSSLSSSRQFVEIDSTAKRPVLLDVHDTATETLVFSFGIAEQCARREKALKFLLSRSDELKDAGLDMSLVSDLMRLQDLKSNAQQPYAPSVLYMNQESIEPLLDLVGDMLQVPKIAVQPDGQVSFVGSRAELNDIVSVVAEFYSSRNSARWRKLSPLVPQFTRSDGEVNAALHIPPAMFETVTIAPLKSPEKTKHRPSPKKKKSARKDVRERDLYKRNYFHACESLLSLMTDKNQHKKTTILLLKKSGAELSELLTQFSIGIAGIGIAVLFSVVCNVACGSAPFCANKFFNTGLGLSLIWLSWAVNKFREAVVYINRNVTRSYSSLKDEEMLSRVETSMKEVYLRTATVMVAVALRFA